MHFFFFNKNIGRNRSKILISFKKKLFTSYMYSIEIV